MDLVHNLKGKHIVYCLALEPDEQGRPRRYVGNTTNCERRMAEHMGVKSGGAAWCKKHKPTDVISCRVVETKEEAAAMEVMLVSLHQANIGYQACKGGRWNMPGDMKKKPPYFEDVKEYFLSPREETSTPPEEEVASIRPTMLPPHYELIRDENGIVEDKPPVSCPCFKNEKDPEGRLRHLAGLVLH